MPPVITYISIGANLGNSKFFVNAAIQQLSQLPHTILSAHSSLYQTEPINANGNDYINAVAQVVTKLSAPDLLKLLHDIEFQYGRKRLYRNAPRTLDLDILLYGNQIINNTKLIIPHIRMSQRAFVLIPLLEITSNIIIPGTKILPSLCLNNMNQNIKLINSLT